MPSAFHGISPIAFPVAGQFIDQSLLHWFPTYPQFCVTLHVILFSNPKNVSKQPKTSQYMYVKTRNYQLHHPPHFCAATLALLLVPSAFGFSAFDFLAPASFFGLPVLAAPAVFFFLFPSFSPSFFSSSSSFFPSSSAFRFFALVFALGFALSFPSLSFSFSLGVGVALLGVSLLGVFSSFFFLALDLGVGVPFFGSFFEPGEFS